MKISINIECNSVEEYRQVSMLLELFIKKLQQKPLTEIDESAIEQMKALEPTGNKFIPLTKWNNYHPWPSVGGQG